VRFGATPVGLAQAGVELERSTLLGALLASAGLLVGGLVMNSVRSVLARRRLPAQRYRGPSIWIMLLFAVAVALFASLAFPEDAIALEAGEGAVSLLGSVVILTAIQATLVLLTLLFVIAPRALAGVSWFGGRATRALGIGLAIAVPVWIAASLLALMVAIGLRMVGLDPQPQAVQQALGLIHPAVAVGAVVIFGPISEELFFRGVVFNAWLREYGYRVALIGSGLLFGVVHMSLVGFVPFVLLGILLAELYRRTGTLLAPIALHVAFNGISVGLALLVERGGMQLPT
jgi:uncharacterized protein